MKRLSKYKFIGVLLALASCTKLDEKPVSILVPGQYFNTEADAEAAVMGSYALLSSADYYGRRLTMVLQLLGDDIDIADIGTQSSRIQLNGFTHDASNQDILAVWRLAYLGIGAANAAIDGIPKVEMNEEKKNALIAEARMIRALNYYHLVQLFGDVPYIGEFVTDPNSIKDVSRTPAAEIYQRIIEDCEFGVTNLPDVFPGIKSRATKGVAHTMLASIYMVLKQWDKAAEHAEVVISNASTYQYGLVNDFQDLWKADLGHQLEHVWIVDFMGGITGETSTNQDYTAPMTGVRDADMLGWSVLVPSPGMYDSFNANDYRKEVSYLTETPVKGVMTPYQRWKWPRIHTAKWCLFPGAGANAEGADSDIKHVIFRYAEVLLMAAESINENVGPTDKAYEYINAVRRRARNTPQGVREMPVDLPVGLSQSDFREAVREERRVELAFEWKRWYDLKRWDTVVEAFTAENAYEKRANVKDYHKLLPIPQEEIGRNPNLLPQNTGY
ncbi:RagB/SusD family nutrient uptake outer membrane protein [Olivibacter domesticus]|uniref:Starch-binding associating with outer membrane n=1 Tax=Olivibacter domesticus TaxID=407022 RepID=A0A1H7QM77_OLID1|nr:RagB/SusD family nutrient uptake outer membrane protein [Olivibacter domesticus]SEL49231.1 Starch-binding associating with outer membrane [Olivibacter domesticus]